LRRENFVILSAMRMLETSLDSVPLFTAAEVTREIENVPAAIQDKLKPLYPRLISALNNAAVIHDDGSATTLSISPSGDLLGTFHPGGKAWTRLLVPAQLLTLQR
jgi:hypothetical protein